jgi:cell wall-associated NlpC family hydrolase
MRPLKAATVAVFVCFVLGSVASAATIQRQTPASTRKVHHRRVESARAAHVNARQVSSGTKAIRERLVRLGTAIHDIDLDCSHFTNYVYEKVGLDYDYQPSAELYKGTEPFVRVQRAMPGDLIVWRGHVGIVVDPDEHTFVSKLNSGVKVANWDAHYWKRRGLARFFRFTGKIQPTAEAELAPDSIREENAAGASD